MAGGGGGGGGSGGGGGGRDGVSKLGFSSATPVCPQLHQLIVSANERNLK